MESVQLVFSHMIGGSFELEAADTNQNQPYASKWSCLNTPPVKGWILAFCSSCCSQTAFPLLSFSS